MTTDRIAADASALYEEILESSAGLRCARSSNFSRKVIRKLQGELCPAQEQSDEVVDAVAVMLKQREETVAKASDTLCRLVSRNPQILERFVGKLRDTGVSPQLVQSERGLCQALFGNKTCSQEEASDYAYMMLKLMVDEGASHGIWEQVAGKVGDRDRVVRDTYHHVVESPNTESTALGQRPKSYFRHYFFEWFTARYDLANARSIYIRRSSRPARSLARMVDYLVLFTLLLPISTSRFGLANVWTGPGILAIYGLYVATLVVVLAPGHWEAKRSRSAAVVGTLLSALHSLVPRLGGSVFVGFLVVMSSEELARFATLDLGWQETPGRRVLAPAVLALSFLYFLLEVARRVRPLLSARLLLVRSFRVATIGFCHSLAAAVLLTPLLRSASFGFHLPETCASSANDCLHMTSRGVFFTATCAFAIGIVLNIIWAEQPVTEPL